MNLKTETAVKALAVTVLAISGAAVYAWGFEAHRMVASLAEQQLTPQAQKDVQRLLAMEPGATLASIATWADENRSRQTAAWHYVNLPQGDCNYVKARDCQNGACMVEAIIAQVAVPKSNAPDAERLTALKYVVHLVGDVHQPLHAGYASDKGGNTYQVQAFGKGTNLHAIWDSGLVNNWGGGPVGLKAELAASLSGPAVGAAPKASQWAEESCKIVAGPGFYPEWHVAGAEYLTFHAQILKSQLANAARRLAAVLNSIQGAR
ncbi:MAG: S1/P1 nuclease [Burkholderiaceae bacterium]|nr:S1/P1 nuclease [Burkholderiaceae bacterium]